METPGWNPFFKYVVRESFSRADAIASGAGAIALLIVAHLIGVAGTKMLAADEFVRSIEIALVGFAAIWLVIMLGRACWWPFHWRLEPHGGLISFLRVSLGNFMWPVILTVAGVLAFILLSGAGLVLLSLQVLNGTAPPKTAETPNTVGNPDFALFVPHGRYRFTWPAANMLNFYLRLDTQRNPSISNNPAFILRNRTNTVAYRVTATWKSETMMDLKSITQSSPKLSKADFNISDTSILILPSPRLPKTYLNFQYYLDDSPKQLISVIAKEEEVYLPIQLWPSVAIYLVDKTPDIIGETSPPFIARVTLDWETSEGKRQRAYRVRITATSAKASSTELPLIDAFLNFSLEEISQ